MTRINERLLVRMLENENVTIQDEQMPHQCVVITREELSTVIRQLQHFRGQQLNAFEEKID